MPPPLLPLFPYLCLCIMDNRKKINRKKFFRWSAAALLVPAVYVWDQSVRRKQEFSLAEQELILAPDLPDGVHFFGRVILVKEGRSFRLLSSKCTHLGCRINEIEGGQLVCPCHGSRYNLQGVPVKGPAVEPLPEVDFRMEETGGVIRIVWKG